MRRLSSLLLLLASVPPVALGQPPRYMVEGPPGIVHYADVAGERLRYHRSADGGRSWATEVIPDAVEPGRPHSPWIVVDPQGKAFLLYRMPTSEHDPWFGNVLACVTNVSGRWAREIIEPGWNHTREKQPQGGAYVSGMNPAAAAVDAGGTLHLMAFTVGWYVYGGGLYAYSRSPGAEGRWSRNWETEGWALPAWQQRDAPFGGIRVADLRVARIVANADLDRLKWVHLHATSAGELLCFFVDRLGPDSPVEHLYRIRKAPGSAWGRPERQAELPSTRSLAACPAGPSAIHLAYTAAADGSVWYRPPGGKPERIGQLTNATQIALAGDAQGRLAALVAAPGIDAKSDLYWSEQQPHRWTPWRNVTSDPQPSPPPLLVSPVVAGQQPEVLRFPARGDGPRLLSRRDLAARFLPVDPVVGEKRGISSPHLVDLDDDGDLDLIDSESGTVYRNEGAGALQALVHPLPVSRSSFPVAVGDLDQDGRRDFFTGNRVLRSLGRLRLRDLTHLSPLREKTHWLQEVVLADWDGDGDLDGYLVHRERNYPNVCYENRGFGRFGDVTERLGIDCRADVALSAAVGDVDQDGDLDLFVGTMGSNRLLRNRGDGTFTDATAPSGIAEDGEERSYAATFGDLDVDGDLDLVVLNLPGPLRVYRNAGDGTFTPIVQPEELRIAPAEGFRESAVVSLMLFDADHDGDPDCFHTQPFEPPHLYENDGTGRFAAAGFDFPAPAGMQLRATVGDYDEDGDPDLIVAHQGGFRIYRNNQDDDRFLKLRVRGSRSHRTGAGAKVWLYRAGRLGDPRSLVGYQEVAPEAAEVHFGTGQASRFDLRVEFLGGRRVVRRDLRRGTTSTIHESSWPSAALWRVWKTGRRKWAQASWWVEGLKLAVLLLLAGVAHRLGRRLRAELFVARHRGVALLAGGYLVLSLALPESSVFHQHLLPFLVLVPGAGVSLTLAARLDRIHKARSLGPFRLLAVLAEGGMSTVWKAKDRSHRRLVALKILSPELWQAAEHRQRFLREVALSSQLDHPHLVRIFEGGEIEGQGYLSMELVAGHTLRDLLAAGESFTLREVVRIAQALAEALAVVHGQGIIHRDVKAANIMRTDEGAIKLMDFGLAKAPDLSTITALGETVGTVAYMSPEQISGKSLDHRTDLYSLGVVLYELVTGRLPFGGEHDAEVVHAILSREPVAPHQLRGDLPPALNAVIMKLLAKDRDQRYADASALEAALAAGVGGESLPPPPVGAAVEEFDLRRFLTIYQEINASSDLDTLLPRILDAAIDLIRAERGFLVLREGDRTEIKAARQFDGAGYDHPESEFSHSIARRVIDRGEPLVIADAQQDPRCRDFPSVRTLGVRSVLCLPLRAREPLIPPRSPLMTRGDAPAPPQATVIGALYFDSRFAAGRFRQADLALLAAFCDQAGIVIRDARLHREALAARRQAEELNRQLRQKEEELAAQVRDQQVELEQTREALERRQSDLRERYRYDNLLGKSPPMQELYRMLDRIGRTDLPVLIVGETGTGKELVARTIHFNSRRKGREFVSINCGALPETLLESELFGTTKGAYTGADRDRPGLFELADGGTLFLDEIAEMAARMQVVLLRALEEKEIRRVGGQRTIPVDVRLCCASNANLEELVAADRFREDLFYRIQGVTLVLPPLRERQEDVALLVDHFLRVISDEEKAPPRRLTKAALRALGAYPWPGNVRELEHELRRAAALVEETIAPADLSERIRRPVPSSLVAGSTLNEILAETRRRVIRETLEACHGNKTEAARRLGIPTRTLYNHLERLGLATEA